MPKDTFYNLPKDKRDRILNAAIDEFAHKGFQKGSMQTIADRAGVAKGSMYQYFESKRELFLYIIDMASNKKVEILARIIRHNQELTFFELMERILIGGIQYASQYPQLYAIYQNIQQGAPDDIKKEIAIRIKTLGQSYNKNLLEEALAKGEIRKDISLDLANYVVFSFIKSFGDFLMKDEGLHLKEKWKEHVSEFIEIMKNGLKQPESCN